MESAGNRGFAGLTPEQRRELARKGGRIAHARGTARQWTQEQARAAAMIAVNNRKNRRNQAVSA